MAIFNLPAAEEGRNYTFVEGFAGRAGSVVEINADGADIINFAGSQGTRLISSDIVNLNEGGSGLYLVCLVTGVWKVIAAVGQWTLTDESLIFTGENITKRKDADQEITNNAVLADVTGLQYVKGSERRYRFRLWIPFNMVDPAPGVQFQIGSTAIIFSAMIFDNGSTFSSSRVQTATATIQAFPGGAGDLVLIVEGEAENDLSVQASQIFADANTITIYEGSRLEIVKL